MDPFIKKQKRLLHHSKVKRRWIWQRRFFGSVSPRLDGGKIPGRPRYREVECKDEVGRTVYWSAVVFDNIYGFSKGSHIVKLRQCKNCDFLGRILNVNSISEVKDIT